MPSSPVDLPYHRPTILIYVVSFQEDEYEEERIRATSVGFQLYERLNRFIDEPLLSSTLIPIRFAVNPDCVDLDAAESVMIFPILGARSFRTMRDKALVTTTLRSWQTRSKAGHLIPIVLDSSWYEELSTEAIELFGKNEEQKAVDEIIFALARLFSPQDDANKKLEVPLFISYAKDDLIDVNPAASKIAKYIQSNPTTQRFFDTQGLRPGQDFSGAIEQAGGQGVFIAVRGDTYASRSWCQRELLTAKANTLVTLTVDIVSIGEPRNNPYGGNSPTIRWRDKPEAIACRAMVEWVKAKLFAKEGARLKELNGLPDDMVILTRPPELLDFAQGPLVNASSSLILHPDPELSVAERAVLRRAHPGLRLLTPTTLYRRSLGEASTGTEVPLSGQQIAISISGGANLEVNKQGVAGCHIVDAVVSIVRTLVSAGASIGYGGLFKPPKDSENFTRLLVQLIEDYNHTAENRAQHLSYYIASHAQESIPNGTRVNAFNLSEPNSLRLPDEDKLSPEVKPIVPSPSSSSDFANPTQRALSFSDVRRVMNVMTDARLVLGGNSTPTYENNGNGYHGPFPGIIEESWRALTSYKPLYIIGGFGGAAQLVAQLMRGEDIPEELKTQKLTANNPRYKALIESLSKDPLFEAMKLPPDIDTLAEDIRRLGQEYLSCDELSVKWNGLTVKENLQLFDHTDASTLTHLVLTGLLRRYRQETTDRLEIELVHGDIRNAHQVDLLVVGAFEGVPVGGAGADIGQAIGQRIEEARSAGHNLIQLTTEAIDASWLYLGNLGPICEVHNLSTRVNEVAQKVAELCTRFGFKRIGMVTWGGGVSYDISELVGAIVEGYQAQKAKASIQWFETREHIFQELRVHLKAEDSVQLTTRALKFDRKEAPVSAHGGDFMIDISQVSPDQVRVAVLPPTGTTLASVRNVDVSEQKLAEYAEGQRRRTPNPKLQDKWGQEMAQLIFGSPDDQNHVWKVLEGGKTPPCMSVLLDDSTSRLPIELLKLSREGQVMVPSITGGVVRRLGVEKTPLATFDRPPHVGPLVVGLIENPTSDGHLSGTSNEAEEVRTQLLRTGCIVRSLIKDEATISSVLDLLADPSIDVIHYSGHAYYYGPNPSDSGLELADGHLTVKELSQARIEPRMAFVNACQSSRLRSSSSGYDTHLSFASLLLRSGLSAFLGTSWLLGDAAAVRFAVDVYSQLHIGQTLESSVRIARRRLWEADVKDWGNYILYGDTNFRLVH